MPRYCRVTPSPASVCGSIPVDLEVLLLRKAFRGRYLLTDEPRGLLGRDVLNSLTLLFDGPPQHWSQPALPP